jgi:putative ABC transport system permease protein
MRRVCLRGLVGRKTRAILTAVAIVLGVAMVSGTFVLTDTINRAFHTIFASSYSHSDVLISGKTRVSESTSGNVTLPDSLVATVQRLPDVQDAQGTILNFTGNADQVKMLDRAGKVIGSSNNPRFGFGINSDAQAFSPFHLKSGRWVSANDQVVIDADTAATHKFGPGDTIRVSGSGPIRSFKVVGVAKFGDLNSLGGATAAIFTVPTARQLLGKQGYDLISVVGKPGVAPGYLSREIQRILPASAQVKTGAQQAQADDKDVSKFLRLIRIFLLSFGAIALFVGAFVIFNSLSITVAQRTREFATLRTLGASGRQVLGSVVLESLVLGLAASLVGLGLGVALAKGLSWLLDALGLSLPQTALVFAPRTVIVSLLVGTTVTVLAGVAPAVKATRVAPIAAVREGAVVSGSSGRGRLIALACGIVGLILVAAEAAGSGGLPSLAIGTLLLFVGVASIASRLVPGIAAVAGYPAQVLGGAAGTLAKRNTIRNPARTASTAAALMIGLALVTLVAVLAQGLVGSDKDAIRKQLAAQYVVQPGEGSSTISIPAERAVAGAGGTVSGVRYDRALVGKSSVDVDGVDANVVQGLRFNWTRGSDATIRELGAGGAVVRESFAKEQHLVVGSPFSIETPAGSRVPLTVAGVYDPPALDQIPGQVIISKAAFDRSFARPQDTFVLVNGSSKARLQAALAPYPGARVLTREEFVTDRSAFVGKMLNLVYVLLALSVLVSVFGMVNTLVLTVFERTRELGMLRAVGMTRRQARRMVRHESIITSLIGAALGLPLGLGLGAVVIHRIGSGISFQLPVGSLVAFVIVAVLVGIGAAVIPAKRAARLNVLTALQYE